MLTCIRLKIKSYWGNTIVPGVLKIQKSFRSLSNVKESTVPKCGSDLIWAGVRQWMKVSLFLQPLLHLRPLFCAPLFVIYLTNVFWRAPSTSCCPTLCPGGSGLVITQKIWYGGRWSWTSHKRSEAACLKWLQIHWLSIVKTHPWSWDTFWMWSLFAGQSAMGMSLICRKWKRTMSDNSKGGLRKLMLQDCNHEALVGQRCFSLISCQISIWHLLLIISWRPFRRISTNAWKWLLQHWMKQRSGSQLHALVWKLCQACFLLFSGGIHTYIHALCQGKWNYRKTCWQLRARTNTYIHTYIQTNMHTYVHTYIYTYICTYIHTYSQKCMQPISSGHWRSALAPTSLQGHALPVTKNLLAKNILRRWGKQRFSWKMSARWLRAKAQICWQANPLSFQNATCLPLALPVSIWDPCSLAWIIRSYACIHTYIHW